MRVIGMQKPVCIVTVTQVAFGKTIGINSDLRGLGLRKGEDSRTHSRREGGTDIPTNIRRWGEAPSRATLQS